MNCKNCRQKLTGRTDKKFCTPRCRSRYHNQINREEREIRRSERIMGMVCTFTQPPSLNALNRTV